MNYRNEYEYAIFLRELKTNVYTWMCVNMLVYLSRSTHSVPGAIVVDSPVSCSFNSNPHLVDHCTLKFVLHGISGHSLMSNQSWFKSNAMPHLKVFSKTNSRIACFTLSLIDTLNQIVSKKQHLTTTFKNVAKNQMKRVSGESSVASCCS